MAATTLGTDSASDRPDPGPGLDPDRRSRQRLGLYFGIAAAVLIGGYLAVRHLARPTMIDMIVYQAEGRAVLNGADLYGGGVNVPTAGGNLLPATYPPFAALLFAPLAWISRSVLMFLVTSANILLLGAVVHLAAKLVGGRLDQPRAAPRWAVIALITGLGLWFEPVWTTLRYGQINLVLAALVLFDLTRAPGSRWRGVGVGLATGIKLTPGVFIVWYLLSGRRREAAVSAATAAATFIVGFAVIPHDSAKFWTKTLWDTNNVGQIFITDNQALTGVVARVLHTESPGLAAYLVQLAVAVGGLVPAAWIARRGDLALGALCTAVVGLLVSPISWSHHWVWAVPVAMLLAVRSPKAAVVWSAVFCSFLIWAVPHKHGAELHLNALQVLQSSLYPLAGVAFLAWAWISSARTQPAVSAS